MTRKKNPGLRLINIRLLKVDVELAKELATQTLTPYQHVIRGWVSTMANKCRKEAKRGR